MSAFVGVWNRDGSPVEPRLLLKLGDTMAHRAPEDQRVWVNGEMGLSARVLRATPESVNETQPACHASGTVLAFDGRLDNREQLLADLGSSATRLKGAPDALVVLAAYERYGEKMPDQLLGDFALALFDPPRRRLLLARDAIGMRPLYYCERGTTVVFASEIKALLAHPEVVAEPDEDMIAWRIERRFQQEDQHRTFFDRISSLPPAHIGVFGQAGRSVKRYWDFDSGNEVRFGSFPEYVDAFRHYFQQAVRRRTRSAGPIAVSLSGGLDSSSVFCQAETFRQVARSTIAPQLIGIAYSEDDGSLSDERVFLRAIEERYRLSVKQVGWQEMGLVNGADEQLWHYETPFLSSQYPNFRSLLQTAQASGARVLLTGASADQVLVDQTYLVDLVGAFKWRKAFTHLRELPRWFTDAAPGAFRHDFVRDFARYHLPERALQLTSRVRQRISRNARPYAAYSEPLQARARAHYRRLSLVQAGSAYASSQLQGLRSSSQLFAVEWYNKIAARFGIDIATPFLDRDLVSFLIAIPGEVQFHNGVPKALLREAMRGVLPLPIVERRWKGDCTDQLNRGVARDYSDVARCLQSGRIVQRRYATADAIRSELGACEDDLRGTITAASGIRDLFALERWLHVFFSQTTYIKEIGNAVAR